jgi:hypothetical protein
MTWVTGGKIFAARLWTRVQIPAGERSTAHRIGNPTCRARFNLESGLT